jgi:hypothetical protein
MGKQTMTEQTKLKSFSVKKTKRHERKQLLAEVKVNPEGAATLGGVVLPNLGGVLAHGVHGSDGPGRARAPKQPGGRRTTITIPLVLDRIAQQLATRGAMPANQAIVALASYAAEVVESELIRAKEIDARKLAVIESMRSDDGDEQFPSAEEMDDAMSEAAEG